MVGDYTLLTRIGEGGMGVVHLARGADGERVALKVLRPHIVGDEEARARLAREVGSLRRIRSPRIAEIVDADPFGPIPFVATRYVPGLSLYDHVHEEGPITGTDLTWFAACLAEALAAVHACGVLHRDVKPSNVLMEGRSPVLIDFGLARVADDPRLTHTGWLLGTPGYLAPEILYGDDATPASDVHSWGATVAFAGTGAPPFGRGPTLAIMDRVRRGEHRLDGLPAGMRGLVEAAMDPDPTRRPAVPDLVAELRADPVARVVDPPADAEDPFTIPLSVAALAGSDHATRAVTPAPTRVETPQGPTDYAPYPVPAPPPPGPYPALAPAPWPVPEPRAPLGERLRRAVLVVLSWLLAGAAVAAFPYLAVAGLSLGAWLVRSASLAVSAAGGRRELRGGKWYDGLQLLLSTPWHLLQSFGTTMVLLLWAGGLGVAGALLGYAAALPLAGVLFLAGTLFASALWWGPGGSRVRGPMGRIVNPLAARPVVWLIAMLLLGAVAAGLGASATERGIDWSPAEQRPFAGL